MLLTLLVLLSQPFSVQAQAQAQRLPGNHSLWGEVIRGFTLNERKDPRLTPHILWFKKNPDYVNRVLNRARPYLYHIVKRVKKKNLPLELALLPAIESAFRAYAYSPGRAAGLWQFIPETGKTYGLKQNWWIDQRRSTIASTDAALHFLKDMSREFKGDWLLALSSYNAGAGNVRKAIRKYYEAEKKKNRKKGILKAVRKPSFWDLNLPKETQGYVPRLLAFVRFIETSKKYKFKLPYIPNRPLTQQVSTGGQQIDLSLAADLSGLPLEELYQHNAGLNQWATPPDGPHQLMLPVQNVNQFENNLRNAPQQLTQWRRHTVKKGETLSTIAQKYHSTTTSIKQQNQLRSHKIRAGNTLTIPVPMRPMKSYTLSSGERLNRLQNKQRPGKRITHRVESGDTLWDIAKKHGVSSRQLAQWNGMAPGDLLSIGKKLTLWSRPATTSLPELRSRPDFLSKLATQTIYYKVRPNDTLSEIAKKFNTSTKSLMRLNKIKKSALIKAGDTLSIRLDATRTTTK
ncbi:MAG: LysM peptidoglycan-binding domain-containing protein [Gammaproteobacteria bacterium]|nr:LysM peptidoglycan-binding domain-containing protein [Gammaproteobacteria bacterium]MBT3489249.1 LysM peptidoglycan-binding domain-containing protein [Gammaproteobacteria bacterium]MBT3717787.1 LysM peptidoglycan-binding domain-containing protein [Gammaproteobacteria bacterium]MBT3843597.1 LysM peptidoglycan-binding domain-containing protein [Gammaproteobacteria bacterium]MBT3894033.1 LysM peptidoglycan-binding domain-containing protein [Gammaproteobacteria bacterium]